VVEQNAKQGPAIADRGYLLDNGHIVGSDSAAALSPTRPPLAGDLSLSGGGNG
jgi:ABC-type branched-subunit amino acid transport system ATPase component